MSTVATANLVGITGIARRLVLDGVLEDTAARQALAMTDAPLAVTNQVATRPDGDGEGGRTPAKD